MFARRLSVWIGALAFIVAQSTFAKDLGPKQELIHLLKKDRIPASALDLNQTSVMKWMKDFDATKKGTLKKAYIQAEYALKNGKKLRIKIPMKDLQLKFAYIDVQIPGIERIGYQKPEVINKAVLLPLLKNRATSKKSELKAYKKEAMAAYQKVKKMKKLDYQTRFKMASLIQKYRAIEEGKGRTQTGLKTETRDIVRFLLRRALNEKVKKGKMDVRFKGPIHFKYDGFLLLNSDKSPASRTEIIIKIKPGKGLIEVQKAI